MESSSLSNFTQYSTPFQLSGTNYIHSTHSGLSLLPCRRRCKVSWWKWIVWCIFFVV